MCACKPGTRQSNGAVHVPRTGLACLFQGLRTNGLPKSDRGAAGVAAGGGGGILGTMFRTHVHVTPPVSRGPAPDIAVTGSSRMPSSAVGCM